MQERSNMKFIVRHRETGKYYNKPGEGFTYYMDLAYVFDDVEDSGMLESCENHPDLVEIIPTENE